MILAAIRANPPEGWSRVNTTLIQQKLKEQEKEVGSTDAHPPTK